MARLLLLVVCVMSFGCVHAQDTEPADQPATDRPPNIVLIMADDLGYGDLGCYGSDTQRTPHIDALAQRGLLFTDYHSNGAVCSPTRAALMTGRYQQRSGVEGVVTAANHRETGMALSEITLAEVLRDAGYRTAMFGKWHLGYDVSRFGPHLQGFETFEGFVSGNIDYVNKIDQAGYADWWVQDELDFREGYLTTVIGDRAVDFINEHADEPFFLYLPHGAPHYPLQGPNDPGFRREGVGPVRDPNVRTDSHVGHQEMITSMDDSIGRVVAALEAHGLTDNTVVIFTSDNGQMPLGSSGPLRGRKGSVYEGGHRVPMVVSWPGVFRQGEMETALSIGMDLMPTLLSIADVDVPEGLELDGLDWLTAARSDLDSRPLHWVHGNSYAMRHGQWKLVVRANNAPELYDLHADLSEANNIAGEHPERVAEMVAAHAAWLTEVREGVEPVSGNR